MDKDIPFLEAGVYEIESFLKMRSHSIAGQIKRVNGLMAYLLLFWVDYAKHSC